ncbi:hypothetical protein N7541_007278 [Penicillium brevicompactum]|uniref:Mitochondrial outer membrane protein OM14 C-terminal domain-containing protein n=1 Tax=Penicillium brevicompactum TaxID=5074 RepID=A0A9W9QWU0_PENBR|nr:uncharacterized protein N7506_011129 [Penicillium brevicompactum]KAJ5321999.1 hypothetical protein N7506_011129 [Penicillium brevicompactum]KAJ5344780.1 hypothetical protein N7452_002784 [Penicillium brevicompactum]KAJ5349551.1 hypothetical protein N7541_007278 [Penicillium brevicompactum]
MSYADAAASGPKQAPEDASPRSPVGGIYHDESESTASLIDVDGPHVQTVEADFLEQDVQTSTQAERIEREAEEKEKRKREEAEQKSKARKAKASGISNNTTNPVFLANAAIATLVGAGLGFGAYKQHARGNLSWELVGLSAGAVGVFGAVDYYVSKWFLQNKFPPK